jgi:hypothetical protein
VSISRARELLNAAETETNRLRRHLIAAAALSEVMAQRPIVVGGVAELYWSRAEYYPTDLDLCVTVTGADKAALEQLHFETDGRYWFRRESPLSFEFPEGAIDGDESRVRVDHVEGSPVYIIGVDDLYLDRLRQSTAERAGGQRFYSALAIAAARYDEMDFRYIGRKIKEETAAHPQLREMPATHRSVLRQVRRRLPPESVGEPDIGR